MLYDPEKLFKVMEKAKLMGILNATPDSFFDGGEHFHVSKAIDHAMRMIQEGADIIDIGGESTRPGAFEVDEVEELRRVIPVIEGLRGAAAVLSIDTKKPKVAKAALQAGARFINDVSGFSDPSMRKLAAEYDVDICVMHMQGLPSTMQVNPRYPEGIMQHLMDWFEARVNLLLQSGVKKDRIILDPGIGFGKTVADNVKILHNLPQIKEFGLRVLLGVSRKSFMGKILGKPAGHLLPTTLATNTLALKDRVDILRVHDVKEHRDLIDFMFYYNS